MLIDNPEALRAWLTVTLEPICDADPAALAKYVLALVKKDKPAGELKEFCVDQLDVFLQSDTRPFVDKLFAAISSKSYLLLPAPATPLAPTQPTSVVAISKAVKSELGEAGQIDSSAPYQSQFSSTTITSTSPAKSSSCSKSTSKQPSDSVKVSSPTKVDFDGKKSVVKSEPTETIVDNSATASLATRDQYGTTADCEVSRVIRDSDGGESKSRAAARTDYSDLSNVSAVDSSTKFGEQISTTSTYSRYPAHISASVHGSSNQHRPVAAGATTRSTSAEKSQSGGVSSSLGGANSDGGLGGDGDRRSSGRRRRDGSPSSSSTRRGDHGSTIRSRENRDKNLPAVNTTEATITGSKSMNSDQLGHDVPSQIDPVVVEPGLDGLAPLEASDPTEPLAMTQGGSYHQSTYAGRGDRDRERDERRRQQRDSKDPSRREARDRGLPRDKRPRSRSRDRTRSSRHSRSSRHRRSGGSRERPSLDTSTVAGAIAANAGQSEPVIPAGADPADPASDERGFLISRRRTRSNERKRSGRSRSGEKRAHSEERSLDNASPVGGVDGYAPYIPEDSTAPFGGLQHRPSLAPHNYELAPPGAAGAAHLYEGLPLSISSSGNRYQPDRTSPNNYSGSSGLHGRASSHQHYRQRYQPPLHRYSNSRSPSPGSSFGGDSPERDSFDRGVRGSRGGPQEMGSGSVGLVPPGIDVNQMVGGGGGIQSAIPPPPASSMGPGGIIDTSVPPPATHGAKRLRCRDYEEKGYCMRGDLCPYDHGSDPLVLDEVPLPMMSGGSVVPLPNVHSSTGGTAYLPPPIATAQLRPPPISTTDQTGVPTSGPPTSVGSEAEGYNPEAPAIVVQAPIVSSMVAYPPTSIVVPPPLPHLGYSQPPPLVAWPGCRPPPPPLPHMTQAGGLIMPPPPPHPGQMLGHMHPPRMHMIGGLPHHPLAVPPPLPHLLQQPLVSNIGSLPQPPPVGGVVTATSVGGSVVPSGNNQRELVTLAGGDDQKVIPAGTKRSLDEMENGTTGQGQATTGGYNIQNTTSGYGGGYTISSSNAMGRGGANKRGRGGLIMGERLGPRQPPPETTKLIVRKIPTFLNSIFKLNKHFYQFGSILNIQVQYEGDPESALIQFATNEQAMKAYRSTAPILNNRFIRVFWLSDKQDDFGKQASTGAAGETGVSGKGPAEAVGVVKSVAAAVKSETDKTVLDPSGATAPEPVVRTVLAGISDAVAALGETSADPVVAAQPAPVPAALTHAEMKSAAIKAIQDHNAALAEAEKKKSDISKERKQKNIDYVKQNLELEKKKADLLNTYVTQQKKLLVQLSACKTKKQRVELMKVISKIGNAADALRAEMKEIRIPVQKSKVQLEKEVLDTELELMTKQQSGDDTYELAKKLRGLKQELSLMERGGPYRGRGGRGRGGHQFTSTPVQFISRGRAGGTMSGTRFSGPGRLGYTKPGSNHSTIHEPVDHELFVSGFVASDIEFLREHFKQFGAIERLEVDRQLLRASLVFNNKSEAEKAYALGPEFPGCLLNIQWANSVKSCLPSSLGGDGRQELTAEAILASLDDDDDEEDDKDEAEEDLMVDTLGEIDEAALLGDEDDEPEDIKINADNWKR